MGNESVYSQAEEALERWACAVDSDYASDLGASVAYLVDNPSLPDFVRMVILEDAIEKLYAIGDSEENDEIIDIADNLSKIVTDIRSKGVK